MDIAVSGKVMQRGFSWHLCNDGAGVPLEKKKKRGGVAP
jgi:hypothetical protein